MFWIDKFTDEIKELILKRNSILNQREEQKARLKAGEAFFSRRIESPNPRELATGVQNVLQILKRLEDIDKEIKDIDTVIVSKLEMYLGNFTARARMPERLNDAGDLIKYDNVYMVPFNSDDPDLREVTPDDIWFLKMIKEAYRATNIGFIEKEEF